MELRQYQKDAVQFAMTTPRCYIAAKPGAGKTGVAWDVIWRRHCDEFSVALTVIVAPKRVVEQWAKERAKWPQVTFLEVVEYQGSLKVRKALVGRLNRFDVIVTSFEYLEELVLQVNPDLLVFDEASRLRSGGRQGSKTWKTVNRVLKKGCRFLVMLSGSPRPGNAGELYAPVFLCDGGAALGKSLTAFRETWMVPDKIDRHTRQVFSWKMKPGAENEFYGAIKHLFYAVSPDLGLQSVEVNRMVTLPPAVRKQYRELEREQVIQVEDFEVLASSKGVLVNKLQQVAQGATFVDGSRQWVSLHTEKLDELDALMQELDGEQVLIFAHYEHDFARLADRFASFKRLDTEKDIQAAREGRIQMAAMHPASTLGVDGLQGQYSVVIWFCMTWSQELYEQANARVVRSGQKETVRIFRILAAGTIDEKIANEVLPRKDFEQNLFFRTLEGK